jgi:hypothetical protein
MQISNFCLLRTEQASYGWIEGVDFRCGTCYRTRVLTCRSVFECSCIASARRRVHLPMLCYGSKIIPFCVPQAEGYVSTPLLLIHAVSSRLGNPRHHYGKPSRRPRSGTHETTPILSHLGMTQYLSKDPSLTHTLGMPSTSQRYPKS